MATPSWDADVASRGRHIMYPALASPRGGQPWTLALGVLRPVNCAERGSSFARL